MYRTFLDLIASTLVAVFGSVCLFCASFSHAQHLPVSSSTMLAAPGRSETLLPDGRKLIVGGIVNGQILQSGGLIDLGEKEPRLLAARMGHPRAYHSATVLPDGSVLIYGGVGADGLVVRNAEIFDVTSFQFKAFGEVGLIARSGHAAAMLIDGRLLILGGTDDQGGYVWDAELWHPRTGAVTSLGRAPEFARRGDAATVRADGSVFFFGGTDREGRAIPHGVLYHADRDVFETLSPNETQALLESSRAAAFEVTGSIPPAERTDFDPDGLIAVRFSKPADVRTINPDTVVLLGATGQVEARITAAQDGMLAFVSPLQALMPGARYTLLIKGISEFGGTGTAEYAMGFDTARYVLPAQGTEDPTHSGQQASMPQLAPQGAITGAPQTAPASAVLEEDDEVFIPGPKHRGGQWRSGRALPDFVTALIDNDERIRGRIRALRMRFGLPVVEERVGVTGIAGWVLRLNDKPLANALVSVGALSTRTDKHGRFELLGLAPGRHELMIDGSDTGRQGITYAQVVLGVNVRGDALTELSHAVYLPRIRAKDWITVAAPLPRALVATHPDLPGLEIHIPAGAVVRDRNGRITTRLAIVPYPVDRAPIPTPGNFPIAFTIFPASAVVQGLNPTTLQGMRIVYPNYSNLSLGRTGDFWVYDAKKRGWFIYGSSQVSNDGLQLVPATGTTVLATVPMGFSNAPLAPEPPIPCGSCASDGDPVDLATGLFVHERTDFEIADLIPLRLKRTYRPGDTEVRGFGIGSTHEYDMYVQSFNFATEFVLVLPNGERARFFKPTQTSSHLIHSTSPGIFHNAHLQIDFESFLATLKLRNGTSMVFQAGGGNGLILLTDQHGNRLDVIRSGGLIQRIVSPSGRYVDFTYINNRISQIRDFTGRTWSYEYVGNDLTKVTYPDNTFEQYTYVGGRLTTVRDRRGNLMVTNEYDGNGRVFRQTLADNAVYQYAYTVDGNGKVTRTEVTDPRNNVRRVDFNADGYHLAETLAVGTPDQQSVTYERAPTSNLILAITDNLGRRTAFTYDGNGNRTSVTRLDGTADLYTYDEGFNGLKTHTNPLNHVTTFTRDLLGNLLEIKNHLNETITFTYLASGQISTVSNPANKTMQLAYEQGDLARITDPLNRVTQRYTDSLGRPTRITDPLGNQIRFAYDSNDRVVRVTDPHGKETALGYDNNNNLISVTDARNGLHQFGYDLRNRRSSYTDPLLKTETYLYDGMGNLSSYTDRRNQITTFTHDARNRRKLASFMDTSNTSYGYDGGGRLTSIVDSIGGSVTLGYDGLDRLTSQITALGSVTYGYDAAGRRSSMTVAGQPQITYTYDDADRLTQITQGSASVQITYDAAGRRGTLTLPNTIQATYGYDDAGQLTSLTYRLGSNVIGDLGYEYDPAGRRVSMTGSLARTQLPAAVAATNYDAANRLSNWAGATVTYDEQGNMLSDGARTLTWDARNRLVAISGGVTATFQYDGLGRRISKTISGNTTQFLHDGLNPVQELSGGTPIANLLTGLSIDEYFRRSDTSGARDLLTDQLGSVLALTDAAGAVQTSYTYEPYGESTVTGQTNANSFQFTGREIDSTGLYYYRARYYDPARKRFISEDPIGIGSGPNFYAYVDGNPVSYTDPSGKILNFLGGAFIGAGIELTLQAVKNYSQGCDIFDSSNYDWFDVGAAAAFGAVAPGWFTAGKTAFTSISAMRTLSSQLGRARTANRINKIEHRIAAHEVGILDVVIPQIAFQGGKALVSDFNDDPNAVHCRCKPLQ